MAQILYIASGALIVAGIFAVISALTFFLNQLGSYDLSDQYGWRNFRKPIIGLSLIVSALLSVVLVVLILITAE